MKREIVLFSIVACFFLFASSTLAQDTTSDYTKQTFEEWAKAKGCASKNNGVCGEAYSNFMMNSLMYSLSNNITGVGDALAANTLEEKRMALERSALGSTGRLIGYMYENPPASGIEYIAYSLSNFGLTKPAYAQGVGYTGLSPIQPIWRAFRNLSYAVLVVVMVVIGFMIMFRMKLNAQTSISIQNALPNIVITLVLITFSYAIAGLLIDLMYFLIALIISLFREIGLAQQLDGVLGWKGVTVPSAAYYQEYYQNANAWDLIGSVVNFESIVGLPNALIRGSLGGLWQRIWEAQNISEGIPQALTFVFGGTISVVGGALLTILISLALLFVFVRLFFIFLNSYIQIILAVILAPIQLLIGAIPGQNTFRNWIMGLIGNLIVFPTAVALFMLNLHISTAAIVESGQDTTGTNLWSPPFLLGSSRGTVDASAPVALIGFGILMLTPTLINTVKGVFAPKPVLPITPGLVFAPLQGGFSTAMQALTAQHYLRGSFGESKLVKESTILKKILGMQH